MGHATHTCFPCLQADIDMSTHTHGPVMDIHASPPTPTPFPSTTSTILSLCFYRHFLAGRHFGFLGRKEKKDILLLAWVGGWRKEEEEGGWRLEEKDLNRQWDVCLRPKPIVVNKHSRLDFCVRCSAGIFCWPSPSVATAGHDLPTRHHYCCDPPYSTLSTYHHICPLPRWLAFMPAAYSPYVIPHLPPTLPLPHTLLPCAPPAHLIVNTAPAQHQSFDLIATFPRNGISSWRVVVVDGDIVIISYKTISGVVAHR